MKTTIAPHRVNQPRQGPISAAYERKITLGQVQRDEVQVALVEKLDALYDTLATIPPVPRSSGVPIKLRSKPLSAVLAYLQKTYRLWRFGPPPRGLYIYGSVGIGKSFLMDLFYTLVNDTQNDNNAPHRQITKRRVHFHEFMLDVHHRIFTYKQKHPHSDAIPAIAHQLAQEAQLLCFDEFQVTDIGDAMVLKHLFLQLMALNVLVVATSNRAPDDLYEGGLNRSLFLPFIDMLKQSFDIVHMNHSHKDYRQETPMDGQSYFWSNKDIQGNRNNDPIQTQLETLFRRGGPETQTESIPVLFGRTVQVTRSNTQCAWFSFAELCGQPLGAADYISLCKRFQILIIDQVPQLNASRLDEARRFVTLIDACYESRTRLVLAARVPLDQLFVEFEAEIESREGDEELFVTDKGGNSSAFATTMIRSKNGKDREWSATGLIGVSLAQLSAVNDVAFSFRRAASRLVEMGGKKWGRSE
jgi:protein AFG1